VLALFCPTYEDLEELKQTLIENMADAISTIKKDHYICGNQDEFDTWFRSEFGIGRKPMTEEVWVEFIEVRTEVQRLMIEQATAEPKRVIKRIIQIQQFMLNPTHKKGGVSEAEIERAREYPLEELLGTKVFKARGKWTAVTHCPFHNEKTPSFYIDKENHYKCFGCSEHGDSISFVMKRDQLKFIEAVKLLNRI